MASILKNIKDNAAMVQLQEALGTSKAESVIDLPFDKIDDMPDNEFYFPYDEVIIGQLVKEIKENGFNDPMKVVLKPDGRYLLISGHQRKLAAVRAGLKSGPAIVKAGLTEKQQKDLWRAENVLHRKISPLGYARLIQSYESDYDKYKLSGGKREYAADKCAISRAQVPRYKAILLMPQEIQERCADPDFPYVSLGAAAKFNEEQKEMLTGALRKWDQKNPNVLIKRADLDAIIQRIIKDTTENDYSDPVDLDKYQPFSGNESTEAEEHKDSLYNTFYREAEVEAEKFHASKAPEMTNENTLYQAAIELLSISSQEHISVFNYVKARNSVRLLRECLDKIDKTINK